MPLCFILFGLVIYVSSVVSQVRTIIVASIVYSGMLGLAMLIVVVICVATVVLPQALVGAVRSLFHRHVHGEAASRC